MWVPSVVVNLGRARAIMIATTNGVAWLLTMRRPQRQWKAAQVQEWKEKKK